MSQQAPFKYPKWKLSSQMDSSAFVKKSSWNFFFLNKILQLSNLAFLMKLKFPSSVTLTQTGA